MTYSEDDGHLACLSSDNSVEVWRVGDRSGAKWDEAIVKKIARTEKRLKLKRQFREVEEGEDG